MLLEPGRVCIKKYGRDAGSRAVVVKVLDNGFVSIMTGVRPKERRCNERHLEFLNEKINIGDAALLNKTLGVRTKKEYPKRGQDKRVKKQ